MIRKIFISIAATLLCCSILCSCDCRVKIEEKRHSFLIYFAGNNNLSSYAESALGSVMNGYIPDKKDKENILMVYYHNKETAPTLKRYFKSNGKVYSELIASYDSLSTNSAKIETLSKVIAQAEEAYPASTHDLALWSHASAWMPEGYFNKPTDRSVSMRLENIPEEDPYAHMVKSFGAEGGEEMDIKDLAKALPYHYGAILFDCCLMSSVEVAYELKDKCDYIVAAPTEMLAEGFHYDTLLEPIFCQPVSEFGKSGLEEICQQYFDNYDKCTGLYRSATIALIDCRWLSGLSSVCRDIFNSHRGEIAALNRNDVQLYSRNFSGVRRDWFYDIDDFVGRIASPQEYTRFEEMLAKCVPFKLATDIFLEIQIEHYSGLSCYIPNPAYTNLNSYYKSLAWNKVCGLIE